MTKQQYIYVLKLIPYFMDDNNWTIKEEEIINRHFTRLQCMLSDGRLILAGRTLEKTFGLVIFEAESEVEARKLMNDDPAVTEGMMTAELFPYHVALIRGEKQVD